MFKTNFNDVAKFYDTITCEDDVFLFVAKILPDVLTSPYCTKDFDSTEIKQWENGEWQYCTLVVYVKFRDSILVTSSFINGLEMNMGEDNHHLRDFANDLLTEASVFIRAKGKSEP